MSRYRRHWHQNYRSKKTSEFEWFQWIFFVVVFVMSFVVWFTWNFFTHCIFAWPIRWDVGTCWHEQVQPAQEKAIENAAKVMP